MGVLRVILGDQLSHDIASLVGADKKAVLILMAEVMGEATYARHHKKKIAFLFSAMRHFAEELRQKGFRVHYTRLDDPGNRGSLAAEVQRALEVFRAQKVVATFPGEYRVHEDMKTWEKPLCGRHSKREGIFSLP